MSAALPDPAPRWGRPPGRPATGITLAPGPGRLAALMIVGIPLLVLLVIIWDPFASSSSFGSQPPSSPPAASVTHTSRPAGHHRTAEPLASDSSAITAPSTPSTEVTATASITPSITPSVTPSVTPTATLTSPPVSGLAAIVQEAYNAINHHHYRIAYSLGLGEPGQSFASFVAGYRSTASVKVTITGVQGDVVTVSLTAVHKDGLSYSYDGTYTVSGGLITSAQIQPVS